MGKQTRTTPPKELTRKQLSRQAKDARTRRWLIYGTGAVVALVIIVLGYGLLDQYVLAPGRPVAVVNGTAISRKAYNKRLAYREWDYNSYLQQLTNERAVYAKDSTQSFMVDLIDQEISSVQTEIQSLPSTALSELIDEQIVKQEAARRGITVSDADLQYNLETQFGYYSVTPTPAPTTPPTSEPTASASPTAAATPEVTATPEITPTSGPTITPNPTATPMTKEQFDQTLSTWLNTAQAKAGFSESDLRDLIKAALLRKELETAIGNEVPTSAEQVHARHILFKTKDEAEAALTRIKAGEDFATLASDLSIDTGSKANGGDLGWFPRGVMLKPFEDVAFSLPVGQVSDVVETTAGFHLILVLDHQTDRPLEPAMLAQLKTKAVNDWFTAQRASPNIKIY
ncbi:MAG: peptidylprolyl isomerase [Anaerolineae bacterium]